MKRTSLLNEAYGFQCGHYESKVEMMRFHQHQEVELNFLTEGSVTYLFNGAAHRVEAGHLALFWAAVPHQLLSTQDLRGFYWLTVPLPWLLSWTGLEDLAETLLQGSFAVGAEVAPDDGFLFARWHQALQTGGKMRKRSCQLEVEARLLRLDFRPKQIDEPSVATARVALGHVEKMAAFLAKRYRDNLSAEDVSRAAGLHPSYAMNLFRQQTGLTILQALTQHRVACAQRLLATTDDKILSISAASGFGSASRFYEVFTAACGKSPRDYRQTFRLGTR